ncbi:MAG TPA: hypothetical protein VGH81_07360 [Rudaea sp.]|jgi:hypothetical protein
MLLAATVDSSTLRNLLMLAGVVADTFRHRRLHPAFADPSKSMHAVCLLPASTGT